MTRTPWGNDKPERRAQQAASHWCDAVGSTVYCLREDCPHCDDLDDVEQDDVETDGGVEVVEVVEQYPATRRKQIAADARVGVEAVVSLADRGKVRTYREAVQRLCHQIEALREVEQHE